MKFRPLHDRIVVKRLEEDGKSAGGIELAGHATVQQDEQAALVSAYRRKLSMALN